MELLAAARRTRDVVVALGVRLSRPARLGPPSSRPSATRIATPPPWAQWATSARCLFQISMRLIWSQSLVSTESREEAAAESASPPMADGSISTTARSSARASSPVGPVEPA
ncbi:MAG: hypothetical protein IPK07_35280 [Deltaproteobacteria bacterium]|nr:hypothetical protein [Deltaproteobacteria bacterium]